MCPRGAGVYPQASRFTNSVGTNLGIPRPRPLLSGRNHRWKTGGGGGLPVCVGPRQDRWSEPKGECLDEPTDIGAGLRCLQSVSIVSLPTVDRARHDHDEKLELKRELKHALILSPRPSADNSPDFTE